MARITLAVEKEEKESKDPSTPVQACPHPYLAARAHMHPVHSPRLCILAMISKFPVNNCASLFKLYCGI